MQEDVARPAIAGSPLNGPFLWYATDYQSKPELWAYYLSEADIAELDAAVASVSSSGRDLKVIQPKLHANLAI